MGKITIEDCLKRIDNRFVLIIIAVLRTKQLLKEKNITIKKSTHNEQVVALTEISAGHISLINRYSKE